MDPLAPVTSDYDVPHFREVPGSADGTEECLKGFVANSHTGERPFLA